MLPPALRERSCAWKLVVHVEIEDGILSDLLHTIFLVSSFSLL